MNQIKFYTTIFIHEPTLCLYNWVSLDCFSNTLKTTQSGGIPQWLDTDVHSAVTVKMNSVVSAMLLIVMLQHWQWQCWDSNGSDRAKMTMCTIVWQRWQLTVLWQHCAHYCHTSVDITVTALSIVTTTTLVCTVMSQCCHYCCSVVSFRKYTAVRTLSLPPMPLKRQLSSLWH